MKRRGALEALLVLAPLAALSGLASRGVESAIRTADKTPIKHVVVIDMENHSFDNIFGFWCDAHPSRCPDGGMPASVKLSNGAVVKPEVDPDTIPDVRHTVSAQLAAMNVSSGVPQMNGWENIPDGICGESTNCRCVSGYQLSQIPNITSLADHFAMSDHTFSMADSPSWGGHLYAVMGSLDHFTGDNPVAAPGVIPPGWGCDSKKITPWISSAGKLTLVPSCVPDFKLGVDYGGAL